MPSRTTIALSVAIIVNVVALVLVGAALLHMPSADAGTTQDNARYSKVNDGDTKIDTIVVRNAECLDAEDSAATLKVVQGGYEPGIGKVTYRCVNP